MTLIELKDKDVYVRTVRGCRFIRKFRDGGLPKWIPRDFLGRGDIVPLESEYFYMRIAMGGDLSGLPPSVFTEEDASRWAREKK